MLWLKRISIVSVHHVPQTNSWLEGDTSDCDVILFRFCCPLLVLFHIGKKDVTKKALEEIFIDCCHDSLWIELGRKTS
jgi:hypothetical protein